jgi:ABC-type transport system involved in cytochrome bd biosynthesis fused ATPase/permease subunit
MGEFSIFHWLVVLVFLAVRLGIFLLVPWLAYRYGKKVGDQQGYIRGYKEGQASKS